MFRLKTSNNELKLIKYRYKLLEIVSKLFGRPRKQCIGSIYKQHPIPTSCKIGPSQTMAGTSQNVAKFGCKLDETTRFAKQLALMSIAMYRNKLFQQKTLLRLLAFCYLFFASVFCDLGRKIDTWLLLLRFMGKQKRASRVRYEWIC